MANMSLEHLSKPVLRPLFGPVEAPRYPDPLISANLYSIGRLDRAIDRVVVPFWRGLEDRNLLRSGYIWVVRYARGGEHLKIRLHGPEDLRPVAEGLLTDAVGAYLKGGEVPEEPPERPQRQKPPPPLDMEDETIHDYPDGTFLWTHYRRSPVILGAPPLLGDDRYAALFTACLGRACGLVLSSFGLDNAGSLSHRRRQAVLLKLLATGLGAVFPCRVELEGYITYHRDWLVRAPVLLSRGRMAKALQILDRYDREMTRMGPAVLKRLRAALQSCVGVNPREEAWRLSLLALRSYLNTLQGPDLDPFVRGPLYPSLFKVFHGLANQLGLNPLNEGLAWHLVLHAVRGEGAGEGFRLVPL